MTWERSDWERASQDDLLEFVEEEGQGFLCTDDVRAYEWRFVPEYQIERLLERRSCNSRKKDTPSSWKRWYVAAKRISERDDDYWRDLESTWSSDPISAGPVIVVENNGRYDIGDGYHRVAIAFKQGKKTIPAVVGRPRPRR